MQFRKGQGSNAGNAASGFSFSASGYEKEFVNIANRTSLFI